jgi:hypothetical protein
MPGRAMIDVMIPTKPDARLAAHERDKSKMENKTTRILQEGREFIDPIMKANGFHWEESLAGKSSGGYSACGQYFKRKICLRKFGRTDG